MTRGILRRIDKDPTVASRTLGNIRGTKMEYAKVVISAPRPITEDITAEGTGHVTLQIVRILREGAWPITRM